jgi:hypothetical protein
MDPPWQLASSNPTRGVSIGYEQLCDQIISELDIKSIQVFCSKILNLKRRKVSYLFG